MSTDLPSLDLFCGFDAAFDMPPCLDFSVASTRDQDQLDSWTRHLTGLGYSTKPAPRDLPEGVAEFRLDAIEPAYVWASPRPEPQWSVGR